MKILEMRQTLNAISEQMVALSSNQMTESKREKFDDLQMEARDLQRQIDAAELDTEMRRTTRPAMGPISEIEQPEYAADAGYQKRFLDYLRTGEKRDLSLSTATQSTPTSVLVSQGFSKELETALKYYGPMLQVCRVHATATGAPLPWPTANDTGNEAAIVGEGTQAAEEDVTLNSVILGAYKYTTGVIKVSLELLQDSNFPLDSWLAEQFGRRLGRKLNADFTAGTGTTEPFGLLTKSTAGPTAAGSATNTGGAETGATSIGTQDLVSLEHSVDLAYRPKAAYMAHDTTIKALKSLLDKYGRPIFEVSENGKLTMINGYPLYPNNDLPEIATGQKTMLFGDFSKYIIRQVKDLSVLRLVERFADFGQVGFIGFARFDGNLIDAGTHPVKYLTQA